MSTDATHTTTTTTVTNPAVLLGRLLVDGNLDLEEVLRLLQVLRALLQQLLLLLLLQLLLLHLRRRRTGAGATALHRNSFRNNCLISKFFLPKNT